MVVYIYEFSLQTIKAMRFTSTFLRTFWSPLVTLKKPCLPNDCGSIVFLFRLSSVLKFCHFPVLLMNENNMMLCIDPAEAIFFNDSIVCLSSPHLVLPQMMVHIMASGLLLRVRNNFFFFISQPKLMLWVLRRTVSMRRFFWAPKTYAKTDG